MRRWLHSFSGARFISAFIAKDVVELQVDAAVKQAHTDKEAPVEMLLTDIYYNTPAQYVRCTTEDVLQQYVTSEEAFKALSK